MLSDILKRQFSGSEQLPKYGYHVTDSILSLRDDRLMFTVRAKGVPFEVTSDSVLENQYDSLNGFLLNIAKSAGSRLALWCHLDHFKTEFKTNYNFSYQWLNKFNANYMKKFEGKDIFENDMDYVRNTDIYKKEIDHSKT